MRLFSYFSSSASYRVRIALLLKELAHDVVPVDLSIGAHHRSSFTARNPFGGVPAIESDGIVRGQSMAILEWLEEAYPQHPLLPATADQRFRARELAMAIATELHAPLARPVLEHLETRFDRSAREVRDWYHRWLGKTFDGLEARLEQYGSREFLFDRPGYFECVLIPQMYNARHFAFDLEAYPRLARIDAACRGLPAFEKAHPDQQPDHAS